MLLTMMSGLFESGGLCEVPSSARLWRM
jgi:hypothetical protein